MENGPIMTAVVAGALLGHLLTVLILILCRLCKMKPSDKPENEDPVRQGKESINEEKGKQRSHQSLMFAPLLADYNKKFNDTDTRDVTPSRLSLKSALPVLPSVNNVITQKYGPPSRYSIKHTPESVNSTNKAVDTTNKWSLNQPDVCLSNTKKLNNKMPHPNILKPGFLRPNISPQTPPRPTYSQRSVSTLDRTMRQSMMDSVPGRPPLFGPRPSLPGNRKSQVDTVAGPRLPPPFLAGINQLRRN